MQALPVVDLSPPAARSGLLGREDELADLTALIASSPLLTLTGAPGIGKTRLALAIAREVGTDYTGGAHVVELAQVTAPELVPQAVAAVLSVKERSGQRLSETLAASLRERQMLLVLDNCEHVIDACATLVGALLESCPGLRVLATSREPLETSRERAWRVPPLSVPALAEAPLPEELESYGAVRLFVERACAVQPGFALNAYVAPDVAEITRRVEGIPLAVELAASRVDTLTPGEIARRLEDRFAFLTNGRGTLSRHQTLEAALDWSHELLTAEEQTLFARLSVFGGGFEADAAEAVCSGAGVDPHDVPDLLRRLIGKSLVVADKPGERRSRYRLFETIRAYAADRLERSGEQGALRRAHARYYLALAEQAEPELSGPDQQRWLERLESERANLRGALEWSLSHGESEWALRLAGALVLFWRVRCHFSEGRDLLRATAAADSGAPAGLKAKALWGAGFLTYMAGELDRGVRALEESLAIFCELDDPGGRARALLVLGDCRRWLDPAAALPLLEQSAELAREAGDPWCLAQALALAGLERERRAERAAARPLFEECIEVAHAAGDAQGVRYGLYGLGILAGRRGDMRAAEPLLEEAVALMDDLGEDLLKADALQDLAQTAFARGDYARAQERLDQALDLIPGTASPDRLIRPHLIRSSVARAQGDLDQARRLLEEALARSRHDPRALFLLQGLGELSAQEGDPPTASRRFEEALDLARAGGNTRGMVQALHGLGKLALGAGDAKRAAALHKEALGLSRHVACAHGIAVALEALARLAATGGRHEHAARLLGAAEAYRISADYVQPPWAFREHQDLMARVRDRQSAARFDAAFAAGTRLTIEEAAAEAAESPSRRGRPSSGWLSLTKREREVAALAAEGLTNPVIADRLFISLSTVKGHLAQTFAKLGVTRRSELVREASRQTEPLEARR